MGEGRAHAAKLRPRRQPSSMLGVGPRCPPAPAPPEPSRCRLGARRGLGGPSGGRHPEDGGTRWALRTDLEPEVNRSRCGTRPIPALVRDLDVKARGLSRGWEGLAVIDVRPTPSISSVAISLEVSSDLPAKAAQTARRFLDQVLDLMRDEGNIFKSASRELACA